MLCLSAGSKDGFLRFWKCNQDYRLLTPLFALPLVSCPSYLLFMFKLVYLLLTGIGLDVSCALFTFFESIVNEREQHWTCLLVERLALGCYWLRLLEMQVGDISEKFEVSQWSHLWHHWCHRRRFTPFSGFRASNNNTVRTLSVIFHENSIHCSMVLQFSSQVSWDEQEFIWCIHLVCLPV